MTPLEILIKYYKNIQVNSEGLPAHMREDILPAMEEYAQQEINKLMKNKLTKKEQYLTALDIVEKYHNQLNLQIVSVNDYHVNENKTFIEDWEGLIKCSARLRNGLTGPYSVNIRKKVKYIEDLTIRDFFKIRNLGHKAWSEFEKLRGY